MLQIVREERPSAQRRNVFQPEHDAFDVLQRAIVTSDLELLQAAVTTASADIATTLQGSGAGDGLTVFAPTNAAFTALLDANGDDDVDSSELNAVDLDRVLQYHVLTGGTRAKDIPTQTTTVQTLLGEPIDSIGRGCGYRSPERHRPCGRWRPDSPVELTAFAPVLLPAGFTRTDVSRFDRTFACDKTYAKTETTGLTGNGGVGRLCVHVILGR